MSNTRGKLAAERREAKLRGKATILHRKNCACKRCAEYKTMLLRSFMEFEKNLCE